jgi:hypothetical protein
MKGLDNEQGACPGFDNDEEDTTVSGTYSNCKEERKLDFSRLQCTMHMIIN